MSFCTASWLLLVGGVSWLGQATQIDIDVHRDPNDMSDDLALNGAETRSMMYNFVFHREAYAPDALQGAHQAALSTATTNNTGVNDDLSLGCSALGVPQNRAKIPLPDDAFTRDRGTSAGNIYVGTLNVDPPILLAVPRWWARDINEHSGLIAKLGCSLDTWFPTKGDPTKGALIDVGGWVGDSSFPSAAAGIDTYVFEPVRYNTNLMHTSRLLNDCVVSEHLTIVNAMVGDIDGTGSIFVTERTDNAAETSDQAQANVGQHKGDKEQVVSVVKLDSFFPSGSKVQNLKVDVQGNELHVLKGAERLLRDNQGTLKVRFEADEKLLKLAGTSIEEVVSFMEGLGYKVVNQGYDIDME